MTEIQANRSSDPIIQIIGMHKWYGDFHVLSDINLEVQRGERIVICGPSGSGKSTMIRCINRLEEHQKGKIIVNGTELTNDIKNIETVRAEVGMVFQHFNLFPHLTILENLTLGPIWVRKTPKKEAMETAMMYLEKVQIAEQALKFPGQLSGGQQQRVALARALAPEPALLLLDEPFSNLDVELRRRLSHEVREILKARNTSAILVTHDQEEAFAVSDQVGVFKDGRLEQWDTPFNLYHEPLTPFVASFIGQGYFIRGQLLDPETVQTELGVIRGNRAYTWPAGSSVDVLLRPDDIIYKPDSPLRALIVGKTFLGASTLYRLQLPTGNQLVAIFTSHADYPTGQEVGIAIAADHLVVFPAQGSVAAHETLQPTTAAR